AVTREPVTRWILGLLVSGILSRVWGTWTQEPWLIVVASCLEALGFLLFGLWGWRSLDSPSLSLLRKQLAVSTGWFTLACLFEAGLRWRAVRAGLPLPDIAGLRAIHAMGLLGGVVGWALGALMRAGLLFVPGWRSSPGIARILPWVLGLGVSITAAGEAASWAPDTGIVLARLGEFIVLACVGAVMVAGRAARRGRRTVPMAGQRAEEARVFRLAAFSAGLAVIGSATATVAAWGGPQIHILTDAVRHLLTVGFLTSLVVAMAFRLIPEVES